MKHITILVSDEELKIIRDYRRELRAEEKPDDYIVGSAFKMAILKMEDYLREVKKTKTKHGPPHGPAEAGTPNLGTQGVPLLGGLLPNIAGAA